MKKPDAYISSVTGKDVKDHIQVTLQVPGKMIKIGNDTYAGPAILDLDRSELPDLHKNIQVVDLPSPDQMGLMLNPMMPSGPKQPEAKATLIMMPDQKG